jgi:hypothetical protein
VELNSSSATITRTLLSGRDTTIRFVLATEDLDRVYDRVIANQLFDVEGLHPPYDAPGIYMLPHFERSLELAAGGVTKRLEWGGGHCFPLCSYPSDDWKRVLEVADLVEDILEEHAEYRSLPPALQPNM